MKNMKLTCFQPEKLFRFFEDITQIPRGSYNEKGIADYLCAFAEERNLRYVRDAIHNVIIFKDASEGVTAAPVILQGHSDMVCEKLPEIEHDFTRDPIDLIVEDGWIRANGTTLGADNGVAVAMMLALLDDESAVHPPLECVFTVSEETGLEGALSLDTSVLKGKSLINLDDGPEFSAVASSAGSARIDCTRAAETEAVTGEAFRVHIGGLHGGHSGAQIHEEHANAILLAARLLRSVLFGTDAQLVSIRGGDMVNAIPRSCDFTVACYDGEFASEMLESQKNILLDEIRALEPGASVSIQKSEFSGQALTAPCGQAFASLLCLAPNGVLAKNPDDNFTVSSSNLGCVRMEDGVLTAKFMPRSSVDSMLFDTMDRISLLASLTGFEASFSEMSPGWKYEEESPLREVMKRVAKNRFGREFSVGKIHAGLECGVFVSRIEGLDAISIGPTMEDIHSPAERLDARSFAVTYEFLKAVVEEMAR